MKCFRREAGRLAVLGLALCCLPATALGQAAVVANGEHRVVIDGDYVRIESPEGVAEISGDWRRGTGVRVADTEVLFAELGAVRVHDHIRLSLAGDVLFDFGSARITEAAGDVLMNVAQLIRDRALGEVLVVGHTDAMGMTASNQQLSEARALGVIRWLQEREAIPADILVGRGMGERQPLGPNTTPDGRDDPIGRARNRRVELFLGTTVQADVRAASLVTVQSVAGEVRIEEDGVDVGGLLQTVRIDATGVQIGGLNVVATSTGATGNGRQTSASNAKTCSAGKLCQADCPLGGCRMTCPAGATCDYTCRGGDCEILCSAGAICDFTCSGGDCLLSCATGSTCETSCSGGDCTRG